MENNNHKKRKVMLIAAFAVAVIALAGVGYAVAGLGYTGTTVNDNNTADGTYIVVTQADSYTGAFNAVDENVIDFDTYTDARYTTTKLYSLANSNATPVATISEVPYYGVKIGDTITFTIAGNTTEAYNLTVKSVGTLNGTGDNGWNYILKITGSGATQCIINDGASISGIINNLAATTSVTAELYIASPTLFQNVTEPVPLVITDDVPNYNEATAKTLPLDNNAHLFSAVNFIFTFEAVA